MAKCPASIRKKILRFYDLVKDVYPVKKMILYGSYAKGHATQDSDIDVGVVIEGNDHLERIAITSRLFHYAHEVDSSIEPKWNTIFLYRS